MFDAIRDEIRRHRSHFGRKLHIGVFKLGGHGDFMQQLAFARAARRRWDRRQATITLITKLSSPCATVGLPDRAGGPGDTAGQASRGTNDVTEEILRGCDFVDSCLEVPATDWRVAVQELAPAFDVFYDVQYVAGTYFRNPRRFAAEQAEANARLARYAYYYSRFPWSNAELAETGQSQWEMLARSSGLDVSEDDLFIHPETGEEGDRLQVPGSGGNEERPGRRGTETGRNSATFAPCSPDPRHPEPETWNLLPLLPTPVNPVETRSSDIPRREYVTLHDSAGGGAVLKCLPPPTFDAMARRLHKLGFVPVQVGMPSERAIAGCVDLRGLTINQAAAVIAGARLHVDIEGGLVYVARAVGTRSVVFFGPTPAVTFGFRNNVNVSVGRCRPCWWSRERWERACPKGHPYCRNLPDEPEAVAAVERGLSVAGYRLSG